MRNPLLPLLVHSIARLFAFLLLPAAILFGGGCSKEEGAGSASIRIDPRIATRVTSLNFETGDCIGVTITRATGAYATNAPFTHDGTSFRSASLTWYAGTDVATVTAYFPYDAAGAPATFTVEADQSGGLTASDLLGAVAREVVPSATAIPMTFQHLLSQLTIVLTNESGVSIAAVRLEGTVATASIDAEALTATLLAGGAATTITPCQTESGYEAILVPQEVQMTVRVKTEDGREQARTVHAAFQGGKRYRMTLELTAENLDVSLSGDITGWTDGGDPTIDDSTGSEGSSGSDDASSEENPSVTVSDKLTIGTEQYALQMIGGSVWMAENLRTLPDGATVGSGGIWYPSVDGAAAPAETARLGYLYDASTAEQLCPAGWHLPTEAELTALIGVASGAFYAEAGFWRASVGSNRYETRSYLLGERAVSDTSYSYVLLFTESAGGSKVIDILSENGYSVRFVKDN